MVVNIHEAKTHFSRLIGRVMETWVGSPQAGSPRRRIADRALVVVCIVALSVYRYAAGSDRGPHSRSATPAGLAQY